MNPINRPVKRPLLIFLALLPSIVAAQDNAEWTHYGGSQHGMQYSALGQITKDNVDELEEVWILRTGEMGQDSADHFAFQANPILVEGKLFFP
ncbi:MAG: hypothetical protein ACR2P6_05450, partial [Gammaproteobacteria bacterium]